MPERSENELRELIAPRLSELVEPGLSLLETEFRLPNFHGAKGFIDILARDDLGMTVVVELKRSDAAARQTLHELHKYTELLQRAHGIGPTQVRCIVLSTDWHELLVPFSAFSRDVPYTVTGYRLLTDEDGRPRSSKPMQVLPESTATELCPHHCIYFFGTRERRHDFLPRLEQAVEGCGIEDYLVLAIDRRLPLERVVYPFALYFAMAAIDPARRLRIEEEVGIVVDPDEEAMGDEWFFEESVEAEINSRAPSADSLEIGYPDKFSANQEDWTVSGIRRHGRYESETIRSDDDLIALVRAERLEHTVRFKDTASPQYTIPWADKRDRLRTVLLGSGHWESVTEVYLDEIESAQPRAKIEIAVFNPCDLLMALCKVATEGTASYFPTLQVLVSPPDSDRQMALIGFLEWDGSTCPPCLDVVLEAEFSGDLFAYFLQRHFNELWPSEQRVAALHGLSYAIQEVALVDGEPTETRYRLNMDGHTLARDDLDDPASKTIFDFCLENESYVRSIASVFQTMALGL